MSEEETDLAMASDSQRYLEGHLLLAMPSMADPRFERSVIYLCAHSADGAMGIIVNRQKDDISFPDLLRQLDIIGEDDIRLPPKIETKRVHVGGPVETGRGFVLHSGDWYLENSTLPIDDSISLTATLDILRAIAHDQGPSNSLLALGYAGWGPEQLEREIQENGWLHCEADPALIFDEDVESKYVRALQTMGVDPAKLVGEAGHA